MFVGFNFLTNKDFSSYYDVGKEMYDNMEKSIHSDLDIYMGKNGSIDGSKLSEDWFPQTSSHVFLSHSHTDEDLAIGFAGWLKQNFNITTFIDSCIWSYANDLLIEIDNAFSKSKTNPNLYNYQDTLYSSSHVHMMLSSALNKMINNSECIIFLNTSNSISSTNVSNVINAKTNSPWIYSELLTTRIINKKPLEDWRMLEPLNESYINHNFSNLTIEYDTKLDHLIKLNNSNLSTWLSLNASSFPENALDTLYMIKNIDKDYYKNVFE
ncbi:hypothetical protein [Clostridium butyricum]